MNIFVKSMLALSMTSAMTLPLVNAATYKVIDKGAVNVKNNYAQQANNNGDMVLSGTDLYNFPVQFQYLDDDDFTTIEAYAAVTSLSLDELEPIENIDALKAGNPTANDLAWTVRWLQTKATDYLYQKVGGTLAMISSGDSNAEITVFDDNELIPQSRSTIDIVKGVTDNGWLYGSGSAPYLPESFVNSSDVDNTFWYREFANRAFFSDDRGVNIYQIKPSSENNTDPDKNYGGVSGILDISETYIAAGFMSTKIINSIEEVIESATEDQGCANPDLIADIPSKICIQTYRDQSTANSYQIRAFKAALTGGGESTVEDLGLLITPHEDDERVFESYAQAVNNEGVVVGYSHAWVDESQTTPTINQSRSLYAAVFKEGEVISLAQDHGEHFNSRAYDINNAGIATGHVTMAISGKSRTKFYYIDTTNVDEMELIIPTDFFDSSSSTARAINENGFIVGEGEVETHTDSTQNPRRTHAFLYDLNNDVFQDLNDLTACNSQYSIIEARDINENNVISASAIYKVQRKDAKGELIFDDQGEPLMVDVVRAVRLEPMEEDGQICTAEEAGKVIRQGASFGLLSLFALLIAGLRRRLYTAI
jgi:gamma-glutamylcyclotransferase (GGCT)/AIG2-like uncharacterized protein YtfP